MMFLNRLWMKLGLVICLGATMSACVTTPSNVTKSRKADAQGMYRVKSGDTLSLIAQVNGVRYTDIMTWNGLRDPNYLEVGWVLRVKPNAKNTPSVGSGTTVATGPKPTQATVSDPEIKTNTVITNTVSWLWPHSGSVVRSFDGNLTKGIVFGGDKGSTVLAASGGEVIYAGNSLRGYGNMVVIRHNDTWSSVYANNQTLLVTQGQRVAAGDKIATMGNTDASRVQLYFEVRQNAKPIDPLKVLPNR